jgi:hypothetical protein
MNVDLPHISKSDSTGRGILAFATQGAGGDDEARLRALLSGIEDVEWFAFDRGSKRQSFKSLLDTIRRKRPALIVMEGTGIAGGAAVLYSRLRGGRYVVSSGDAVGPFVAAIRPAFGPIFTLYEKLLCRFSSGFIGWSPYLVGRALTFGAIRAVTLPGWAPTELGPEEKASARERVRDKLQIPRDALVIGIVGSLAWSERLGYCYGYELIRAMERVNRQDVWTLIVGDGAGRPRLARIVEQAGLRRCLLPGRMPRGEVPHYLAAMDLASLPQSLDAVGMFRYTTKLSEYIAAGLPIVTGRLPLAYDLDGGWIWRIPGSAPWNHDYIDAMANLIGNLSLEDLEAKRSAVPIRPGEFDRQRQVERATSFFQDILSEIASR